MRNAVKPWPSARPHGYEKLEMGRVCLQSYRDVESFRNEVLIEQLYDDTFRWFFFCTIKMELILEWVSSTGHGGDTIRGMGHCISR